MIRLNCFFQADGADEYKDALRAAVSLTEKSRKHQGCVAYDVFQSATRSDVFMICETWIDQPALDAHSATAEFVKFVGEMQKCDADVISPNVFPNHNMTVLQKLYSIFFVGTFPMKSDKYAFKIRKK